MNKRIKKVKIQHSPNHFLNSLESNEFNKTATEKDNNNNNKEEEGNDEVNKENEIENKIIPIDLDDDRIDYYLQSIEYYIYLVEGDQCIPRVISISGNILNVLDEFTLDVVFTYKISEFKSFRLISLPSSGINIGYEDDEIEFYVFIYIICCYYLFYSSFSLLFLFLSIPSYISTFFFSLSHSLFSYYSLSFFSRLLYI